MGIIACAALYYYCKDGSLLNDFVRTCLKLRSSLCVFFFFLFFGGGGVFSCLFGQLFWVLFLKILC